MCQEVLYQEISLNVKYCGGYSGGEPPLPIPNREVKPAIADGTAPPGGRVGSCRFSGSPMRDRRTSFFCPCVSLSFRFLPVALSFLPFLSFFLSSFPSFTFLLGTDTHSSAEPLQPSTDGGRMCVKSGKMASSFHFRWKVVTFSYPAVPFLGGGDAGGWSLTESECVEDGRPSGEAVTARVSD